MAIWRLTKRVATIAAISLALYLVLVTIVFLCQRSMLYLPTHVAVSTKLTPWLDGQRNYWLLPRGSKRPYRVWLMMHGNAQAKAADRDYALSRMSDQDSLYVLEYPGLWLARR